MPAVTASARRWALVVGALVFVVAGSITWNQAPRFVWLNTGLSIDYAWPAAAGAWLAAGGAVLAGTALSGRARWAPAAAALLGLGLGVHMLLYRVTAEATGLGERGLLGTRMLAWKDVGRVEAGSRFVVVWGRDEMQVRIDAASFPPEDRARLDRTIARRVREATGR